MEWGVPPSVKRPAIIEAGLLGGAAEGLAICAARQSRWTRFSFAERHVLQMGVSYETTFSGKNSPPDPL